MGASSKHPVSRRRSSRNRQRSPSPKPEEEKEIDYAATADAMYESHSDGDGDGDNDDETSDRKADTKEASDDDDDSEDVSVDMQDASSSDDDDEDEQQEQHQQLSKPTNNVTVDGEEPCTFDLRNLLAVSAHPIDTATLYKNSKGKSKSKGSPTTIPSVHPVNESYLLHKARAGCNQLIGALWQLPMERSDVGPMVLLPSYDDSKVPRALPPPPPKQETKWEKFAKEKGIGQNKDKRSQKIWDEQLGEWQYRHGYQKANASDHAKEWPIMEVSANDDPYADPWERQRDEKRGRVDKNREQRMRNEERSGNLVRGTTNRLLKSRQASFAAGRAADGSKTLPVGLPVDLQPAGRKGNSDLQESSLSSSNNGRQRGKPSTTLALLATQRSTASLGKFDKMREGEPERRKAATAAKKRKFESSTDTHVTSTEAQRSMKLLSSLSGGVEKERDRRKGKLAIGETAYDYDYEDGLGAGSFKKKKGRAGSGKMKKMSKRRIK